MMTDYLKQLGIFRSTVTIHHYMKALGLRSIVRRKNPVYKSGITQPAFPNLLKQQFSVDAPNKVWCTDFTYLPQPNGKMFYNCTIIDLYCREAIATVTGRYLDTDLAIKTLIIALKRRKPPTGLLLHSDQGTQFTSANFRDFCCENNIEQSMSRAGCPYDNAVMERFFNTFKHEFYNMYRFNSLTEVTHGVEAFVYGKYNHSRPHRANGGLPPYSARCAV